MCFAVEDPQVEGEESEDECDKSGPDPEHAFAPKIDGQANAARWRAKSGTRESAQAHHGSFRGGLALLAPTFVRRANSSAGSGLSALRVDDRIEPAPAHRDAAGYSPVTFGTQ